MAQFSGAVKLADLNDFIAPSQACVVKLDGSKDGAITLDNKPEVTGRSEVRTVRSSLASSRVSSASRHSSCSSITLQEHACCLQIGVVQLHARAPAGFQQTAPVGPDGAIKVTLQVCCLPGLPYGLCCTS